MSSKSMISLLALLLLSRTSAVPTGAVPTELANEGTCANGANGDGTCAAVPEDDALHLLQTKIELTLNADHAKGARAEADHAKGARAEADHAKGARAEEEDDDARAQEGEEDDAGAKAPTLHPVASCNQCAQSWCDASRPPEINDISVGASKGVIGSTLAAWGCDKVSSSTTIWRNSASGVVYAVEQAQTCTKWGTTGWHSGTYHQAWGRWEAPNGQEWTWQQCSARCWNRPTCEFWTLQLTGAKLCLLMRNKGAYHAGSTSAEGPRNAGCAQAHSDTTAFYGPDKCVQTKLGPKGTCLMETKCNPGALKDINMGFTCVEENHKVTRPTYGANSFNETETFDTLIACKLCLGLDA